MKREKKVSRLMGEVKRRGLGGGRRAERADFTTETSTGSPEQDPRSTCPGHWEGAENGFVLRVFIGHISSQ